MVQSVARAAIAPIAAQTGSRAAPMTPTVSGTPGVTWSDVSVTSGSVTPADDADYQPRSAYLLAESSTR